MFKVLSRVLFNIFAAIGCLAVTAIQMNAQQWQNVGNTQPVSTGGSGYNNIIVDYAGNYYISYYDVSVGKGSVQKFDGNSWSYAGGSAGITPGTATYNALSSDHSGNVYYTNQKGWPGTGMEVRKFSGSSWSQLPDASSASLNYHASTVAPSGVLFSFSGENSGTVKRFINGAWEQVGNSGFSSGASYAEMVIGSNNKVYTCNVSGGVQVYENSITASASDTWSLVGGSIVDASSSSEQYNSDIAIDAANNLYVAYVSNSANGRKLNVKKFNGTSWVQLGAPNFSNGKVQHVAVAVSASGQPYVVASRWENDNYSRNTVYKFDTATQDWNPLGGDFISDGQATFNDLVFDNIHNNLVLVYSESGVRVKKISQGNASVVCNNTDPGSSPGNTGCVTFTYRGQTVTYTTVRGADGKIWLQQNLGSTKVAGAVSDADAYGDLFQWGRWDDGHQLRNSATAAAPSPNSPDGLGTGSSFILGSSTASWWSGNSSSDQWSASNAASVTSANGADPCKAIGPGWKMPSQADWANLIGTETVNSPAAAYASNLKLPAGGYRSNTSGGFTFVGQRGYFWSSDTANSGGKYLYIGTASANASSGAPRGQGASVRCIKDLSGLNTSDITLNTTAIYPNPTRDMVFVKTDSSIGDVFLTAVAGQKIPVQFSGNQVNMQGVPDGVYILHIQLKNGKTISEKIIKK
ncbi:T9SS type A sorting domain-containing protein [uncultured Chryseobacterium sp.]|uniref:T9SS type A sorting domain-containing protein n=1 Tax=uncultured Chryseobacterium sp. TaxID=259322 RepID=UPI0025E0B839|nr:T9SS type A sorting domain-containing protein [uncultured Chryseobacterium sp.]